MVVDFRIDFRGFQSGLEDVNCRQGAGFAATGEVYGCIVGGQEIGGFEAYSNIGA